MCLRIITTSSLASIGTQHPPFISPWNLLDQVLLARWMPRLLGHIKPHELWGLLIRMTQAVSKHQPKLQFRRLNLNSLQHTLLRYSSSSNSLEEQRLIALDLVRDKLAQVDHHLAMIVDQVDKRCRLLWEDYLGCYHPLAISLKLLHSQSYQPINRWVRWGGRIATHVRLDKLALHLQESVNNFPMQVYRSWVTHLQLQQIKESLVACFNLTKTRIRKKTLSSIHLLCMVVLPETCLRGILDPNNRQVAIQFSVEEYLREAGIAALNKIQ